MVTPKKEAQKDKFLLGIERYNEMNEKEQKEFLRKLSHQIPATREIYDKHPRNEGALVEMALHPIFSMYDQLSQKSKEMVQNYELMDFLQYKQVTGESCKLAKACGNKMLSYTGTAALMHESRYQ